MGNGSELDNFGGLEVAPFSNAVDLGDPNKFTKLELTKGQQIQMSTLMSQLPAMVGMDMLSDAMVLKFPEGIQGTLVQLKNGGVTTTLRNPETGKFVGTAWLESTSSEMMALGAFTAMSVASGQYFLAQINNRLTEISTKLDNVLMFLEDDKRAELQSEVNFVRFAQENYISVMEHSEQRIATLVGLQNAKKVAMKDIEFYFTTLGSDLNDRKLGDAAAKLEVMVRHHECLNLALQLYTMSSLLEVYYAQNFDPNYISFVKSEASQYISICEKKGLNYFAQLQRMIFEAKDGVFAKLKKDGNNALVQTVESKVTSLMSTTESPLQVALRATLDDIGNGKEYCLSRNGEVYLRVS